MYCTNCGHEREEDAVTCASCGQAVRVFESADVPSHLVLAILSTIFFCPPVGAAAVWFATQVNAKAALGDVAGAQIASRKAKKWGIAAVIAGVLIWIIVLVLVYRMIAAAAA